MNKLYKYIVIIVMIVLAIVQVFYIIKIDKGKNIKVYNNAQKIIYNHKTLKEFNEELNCLKEKTILSANEINEKWYVKIKIEGNKEELLNEISKLENYNISDYIINKNKDENSIVLEISVKDVV
ncbi:hypothetical protein psyc5s11_29590 [Clostridium gelidum]|uniref:Uncharacterized protein n=1 Tax=Clostridium gelidum TaxID=704125 RepID=A0ABN6J297_9CLOT|nr:hypothetical protein [Clostridium gelidum]BCZ46892.1 hypothetical protein psyc5s11_29590 [Clostridium gelidum]